VGFDAAASGQRSKSSAGSGGRIVC